MEIKDINTIADCERYIDGCLNDYEAGICKKSELKQYLFAYTLRLLELGEKTAK